MTREFSIVWDNSGHLLNGLLNTAGLAVLGMVLSVLLGSLLAILLMARSRPVSISAQAFVDLFRCFPFLLLAYLVYFGLPSLGLNFDNWTSGLVAIVLYNTAYMAEILRGVWRGLPRDGIEAATAFGFQGWRLFLRIILPQVFLIAAPMMGNQMIQIIKDTAFLSIIAVPELTHVASGIQSQYYVPFAAFLVAVLLYWTICSLVEAGVFAVERLARERR